MLTSSDGADQLVEPGLHRRDVAVLGVLDHDDHHEGDDRGRREREDAVEHRSALSVPATPASLQDSVDRGNERAVADVAIHHAVAELFDR